MLKLYKILFLVAPAFLHKGRKMDFEFVPHIGQADDAEKDIKGDCCETVDNLLNSDKGEGGFRLGSCYFDMEKLPYPAPRKKYGKRFSYSDFYKHLKREHITEIPVKSLPLSVRSLNGLNKAKICTLKELLSTPIETIQAIPGLGRKSLDEIIEVRGKYLHTLPLYDYILTDKRAAQKTTYYFLRKIGVIPQPITTAKENDCIAARVNEIVEDLGADFCLSVFDDLQSAKRLYHAVREISAQASCLSCAETIAELIGRLNKKIQNAATLPLAEAYCRARCLCEEKRELLTQLLGTCATVTDISQKRFYLCDIAYGLIMDFLGWLSFDIDELGIRLINRAVNKKRYLLSILDMRSRGLTLEAIGCKASVSRERVRQCEAYAVKRLNAADEKPYFMDLVSAILKGEQYITDEDFLSVFRFKGKEILLYLFKLAELDNYEYDKELGMFTREPISLKKAELKKQFAGLPAFLLNKEWPDEINRIAKANGIPYKLAEKAGLAVFKKQKKYYAKRSVILKDVYERILLDHYPNGIKLYEPEAHARIRELAQKTFGDIKLPQNNRALDARIADVAVLWDRGTYIHPSYIKLDKELMAKIDNYIRNMPRTAISYAELFSIFRDELAAKTNITNRYALQGAIKHTLKDKYYSIKDAISKSPVAKLDFEIDEFVKKHGIVTKAKLMEEFKGLRDSAIFQIINRCPEIISVSNARYIHASALNLKEDDYRIKDLIKKHIRISPLSSKQLMNILLVSDKGFLQRNNITDHYKLYGILSYMFRDEFYFSRPFIAQKGEKSLKGRRC